jgi:tetratricopeptide (TPR) repeat protein
MDVRESLKELQRDPKNLKVFTNTHDTVLAEGSAEDLSLFLDEFFSLLDGDPGVETFLIQVGHKARTLKDEEKVNILYTFLGKYYLDKLKNREKAEIYLRNVKVSDVNRDMLTSFYVDFYAEKENWRRLEEFLGQHMAVEDGASRDVEVRRYLAEIAEIKGRPEKAVAFLQAALQADEKNVKVLGELQRLYRDTGKWHSLIDLLEKEAALLTDDAATRTRLLMEVASIYRKQVGSDTKAVAVYQSILEFDATNLAIIDTLAELYTALQRWADLVTVLRRKHDVAASAEDRVAILLEIGQILVEKYAKTAEAVEVYEEILKVDPAHREAIARIKDIYEKRRDYERLLEVNKREIALEPDPEARFARTLELARMANERVRKVELLIALWEEVLAGDSTSDEALQSLEHLYERQKEWKKLAEVLERKAAMADEAAARLAVLDKLATVLSVRLGDEDATLAVYRRILEVDRENRKAVAELKKILLARSDWDGLDWLYRNYATLADLVRVLESKVATLEDPSQKVGLLFRVATLWLDELDQKTRAVRTLEQVLEIDPENRGATERMIPIYQEIEDWKRLVHALGIKLRFTEAPAARQDLHVEMAGILEGKLNQPSDAFFHFADAFRLDWRRDDVKANLYRLADATDNHEPLVLTLIEVLDGVDDVDALLAFQKDVARLYDERLHSPDEALSYYAKVLDLDPADVETLKRVERIHRVAGNAAALVEVLVKRVPLAESPDEKRKLLAQVARLRDEQLDDVEGAIAAYQAILEDEPRHVDTLHRLTVLYLKAERWADLKGVLETRLAILTEAGEESGHAVAELHKFLGMLTYSLDGEPSDVVDAYERALKAEPGRADVVELLEQMITAQGLQRRIAEILEPVYLAGENWERLADALGLILKGTRKKDDKLELLFRRGEVFRERLGKLAEAYDCFMACFDIDPSNADVRETLFALAEPLDRFDDFIVAFEKRLKETTKPEVVVELSYLLARAYTEKLGDTDAGARFYKDVLDLRPNHTRSLDALEQIYQGKGLFGELIDIYRKKAELSGEEEERVAFWFRLARVYYDHLQNKEEAVAVLRTILEARPDSLEAWRFLDRIHADASEWENLRRVLESTLPLLLDQPAERIDTLKRLATLLEVHLDAPDRAVETLREILSLEPGSDYVVGELERFFGEGKELPAVLDILEPIYVETDRWQPLVALLEKRVELTASPRERVGLHYRIAETYSTQGADLEFAFLHYAEALKLLPDDETTLDHLEQVVAQNGDWKGLVALLAEVAESMTEPEVQKRVFRRIADLAVEPLNEAERAITFYTKYLEVQPDDLAVIDKLAGLLRGLERWTELIAVLRSKASLVDSADERKDLLLEVGSLLHIVLGNLSEAVTVYEEVYQAFPGEGAALEALETLYTETEAWSRLVWVHDEYLKFVSDTAERKRHLNEKAVLFEQLLSDPDSAVLSYLEILDLDTSDLAALKKLDELYVSKAEWPSVIDTLEKIKPLVPAEEALAAEFRIGRYLADKLEDPAAAVARYQAVLASEALAEQAVEALKAVFFGTDLKERVLEILKPRFLAQGRHADLVALLEHMVEVREELSVKRGYLEEIAGLQEEQLKDADAAYSALARGFELNPGDEPAVEALAALARRSGRLGALVATLVEEAGRMLDEPQVVYFLRKKAALVLKDELGDFERAIAFNEESLKDFPGDRWILHELDELYGLLEKFPDLARVLDLEIESCDEIEPRVAFLFRKAALATEHLGNLDLAFDACRDILGYQPGSQEAVQRLRGIFDGGHRRTEIAELLEPVYAEVEDWDSLLELNIRKLEDLTAPDERFETCHRVGELFVERKQSPRDAMHWYGEAFLVRPDDLDLERRLEGLAADGDAWMDHAAILLQASDAVDEDDLERRVDLLKKAAAIHEERLGEAEEALGIYLRVHALDAAEAATLEAMARLYGRLERWEDLAATLEKQAAGDIGDSERESILLTLADLLLNRIGDIERAKGAYRRVLELDDHQHTALLQLADIHAAEDAHEDRLKVLEALYEVAENDDERVDRLFTMARLLVDHLGRGEDALAHLDEILTIQRGNLDALHLLQDLNLKAEGWARLVEVYQIELEAGISEGRRLFLNKEMAQLALDRLDDAFLAQEAMERALALAPDDAQAVQFLRRVYRENAQFEKLRDTLSTLLARAAAPADQTALYEELGEIYTDYLHDPESAVATWKQLLELSPGNRAAILSLEKLFREEQRWADYASIAESKLALLTDAEELKLTLLDIGSTWLDKLGDPDRAAATYEKLIDLDPNDLDSYPQVERIYEENARYEDLARVLERKLAVTADNADKVMLHERLGRLFDEKLLDAVRALAAYRAAFELDLGNVAVVDEIEKIATRSEKWSELYDVLRALIEAVEDDRKVEYLLKAARIAAERLGEPEASVALFQRILDLEPENETALKALEQLYEVLEDWNRLAETLKRLSAVSLDPMEKVHYQNAVAHLFEDRLKDVERAVTEFRATLDLDEMDSEALGALERIFRKNKDFVRLVEVLGRKVNLQPEHEAEIKMEIGDLYEQKIKDATQAIATYEDVLTYHPQHRQALERLESLYGEKEDYRSLAEVFERLLFVVDEAGERLRVCRNLAMLQEQVFNSKEGAVEYYLKIREIDRNDPEAIENLDRLYRELKQWEDAAQLYRELLEGSADAGQQERLHRQLADLYLDQIEDLDSGIRELKAVLDLVPGDEAIIERLTAIYEKEELWDDLVVLLDFLAEHAEESADRIDLLYRKCELLKDKLYRVDDVIAVLDRIVELDPSQVNALGMLAGILEERGEIEPIFKRLNAALEAVEGDLARAWIHTALGGLKDRRQGKEDEALEEYERALTYIPDYADAIEPLAEIYVRKERWEAAEPLLTQLLQKYEDSGDLEKQCALFFRIGRTAENLMDTERALLFYKKAVAIKADFVAALLGLARLNYRKGYLDQAEKFYKDVLQRGEDDLAMEERITIYKALGDIALKQGKTDKAGEYLQRVQDFAPDSEDVLGDLARFFEQHGDWDSYIRYKRQLAGLKKDPLDKMELLLSIGDIYKDKLQRLDLAAETYQEVISLQPDQRAAWLRLVQMYLEAQQYDKAIVVLGDMNQAEKDPERRAMNALTIAEIYRARLQRPLDAIPYYNAVLDENPARLEAFRAIDEILTQDKNWGEQEKAYLKMLQRVRGKAGMENVEFMLCKGLGEIYRSRMKNFENAVAAFQMAARLRPTDVPVHEILADLYERIGKLDQSIEEHRGLIIAEPNRVESYRTLFRLFNDARQYDKAWCMAGILNLLKKANEQEQHFYRQSRAVTLTSAKRPAEEMEVRENVFFPGENKRIGDVFQIIYQVVGNKLKGRDIKEFGLKKKHQVELQGGKPHAIHDIMASINRYLRVPLPVIYRSSTSTGLRMADTNPPALIIGEDLYAGGKSAQELAYILGKYMAYFHPLHRMAALYHDPLRLKVLYLAAEYHCFPDTYSGIRSEAIDSSAREIAANLSPQLKGQLAKALEEARAAEGGSDPNLERWLMALEYTAVNVGFTVCNDIEVAANLERDPSMALSGLTFQDKVRQLVLYAISKKYETITDRLGIQVQSAM